MQAQHGGAHTLALPQLSQHCNACPGNLRPSCGCTGHPSLLQQLHQATFCIICVQSIPICTSQQQHVIYTSCQKPVVHRGTQNRLTGITRFTTAQCGLEDMRVADLSGGCDQSQWQTGQLWTVGLPQAALPWQTWPVPLGRSSEWTAGKSAE